MLRTVLRVVHPLVVARLVLHGRAYALIAVAVVLLPFRHEPLLRVREAAVRRAEPLLRGHRAATRRRGDHVAVLADADGDVADVHGDLAGLRVAQGLRQSPDVVVGEAQCLDLRQLRVLWKGRQGHPQALQGVVQGMHPVTLAVVRLYPSVPLQPEHLFAEKMSKFDYRFDFFIVVR